MLPHIRSDPEPFDPLRTTFPALPIVTPDPPQRAQREKYGSLFYLGIAGLFVVLALVGWFAYGVWSLRDVWAHVYVLHDRQRPEAERIQAAYALSHDRRVTDRQLWDISLRKDLPPLARYVTAEALTAEAVAADPRGYVISVARSEGWPDWLRLLLVRPLAYAAARGDPLPREPVQELVQNPDPALSLWAAFAALAHAPDPDPATLARIENVVRADGPNRELARLLLGALQSPAKQQQGLLDEATQWLRTHHPGAARLWAGWEIRAPSLVPRRSPPGR
jgi:hypothetical protein